MPQPPNIADELATLRVPVDSLVPHPRNANVGDVSTIADSLRINGQYKPIVVQASTRRILAGNHTWAAARALEWPDVAAVLVDVDEPTALRILAVDNRAAQLSHYDDAALHELLTAITAEAGSLVGTGWLESDLAAIAELNTGLDALTGTGEAGSGDDVDLDDVPEPPAEPVTRPGDLWLLGPHRVLCGDARNPEHVARLMAGAPINLAFTSPPYADRRKYDESSPFKPIPPAKYVQWFEPVQANVAAHLAPDGSWFVNIKAGVTPEGLDTELYVHDLVLAHARQWGWHYATEFCWERPGVPKRVIRRFKNAFEPVYQFAKGDWKMRPDEVRHWSENVPIPFGAGAGSTTWSREQGTSWSVERETAKRKRKQGTASAMVDVQGSAPAPGEYLTAGWAYPSNKLPSFLGSHDATGHPAAFPVGLPTFFIKAYTDPGDAVYDPFAGSGSTIIAAHRADRTGYGVEISPGYVDTICRRFQRLTGTLPVLESSGEPHNFSDDA